MLWHALQHGGRPWHEDRTVSDSCFWQDGQSGRHQSAVQSTGTLSCNDLAGSTNQAAAVTPRYVTRQPRTQHFQWVQHSCGRCTCRRPSKTSSKSIRNIDHRMKASGNQSQVYGSFLARACDTAHVRSECRLEDEDGHLLVQRQQM